MLPIGTPPLRRALMVHISIFLLFTIAIGFFDWSLELGQFQGLVFLLYLAYAALAQTILGLLAGSILWFRGQSGRAGAWGLSAILVAPLGYGLVYLVARFGSGMPL
jgi:hypothetical protein